MTTRTIAAVVRRAAAPVRRTTVLAGLRALLALGLLAAPLAVAADEDEDPNLDQTFGELAIVHGERVLEAGHIDMGPKYEPDGTWRFLIHDDAAKADATATSVWRYPEETVFHVLDAAKLVLPEDPTYSFVGASPGAEVFVVPQTQNPEVVWIGWNTQDPKVMTTIDRGVTLRLGEVRGPGVMTAYLQSGMFGEPELLWDSRSTDDQPVWVDVNTHTHANWVFTEPGVYLVELTAEADLIDGSHVSDTQRIRFAVGTATLPDAALAATWDRQATDGARPGGTADAPGGQEPTAPGPAGNWFVPVLTGLAVLAAAGLAAWFVVMTVRGNRVKRRILEDRRSSGEGQDPEEGDEQ
ncbi:MAG: choice-of-anchor M domain-containing protein [Bifidobacteriaceae bacterium]|jgi:surface-anchored protein|nr:choice-of-anchor M domain-containing protein [Bifidobacteriaceae bacterium]